MESAPTDNDFDFEDDKESKPSKSRASNSSDRAVTVPREGVRLQPYKVEDESAQENNGLWRRLIGGEQEKTEPVKSIKESDLAPASASDGETEPPQAETEAELPLTALSPEEESLVVRQLIEADIPEDNELTLDEQDPAVAEVINHFHDEILTGNKTLPEAFDDTLDWLESDEEVEAVADHPIVDSLPVSDESPSGPKSPVEHRSLELPPDWPGHFATANSETVPPNSVLPETTSNGYDRSDLVGSALVGGLVGYMIGRRRGRIKTEKRLIPVQKKLEKQVKGLREDIKQKESTLREKAAEFARGQQRTNATTHQPEQKHLGQMLVTAAESLPMATAILAETGNKKSPETDDNIQVQEKLMTNAEWRDKPVAKAEQAPLIPIDKHVETMSQKDLLELSSKIIVDGASLKQAYEAHQVGERALRRMVSEHLRGGDIRQSLHNESVEHEIDFERDPQLRDRGQKEPKSAKSNRGGPAGLQALIQQAGAGIGYDEPGISANMVQRSTQQASVKSKSTNKPRTHLVDAVLLSVIASLVGLIILLIIGHS